MRKLVLIFISLLCFAAAVSAQQSITYQEPPAEILELADFKRAPSMLMDSRKSFMLFAYFDTYKSIADLYAPEVRLAGLRVNPVTSISSTAAFANDIQLKQTIFSTETAQIAGLPENPRMSNFGFSPDETKLAFTNTTDKGVELWYIDIKQKRAYKLTSDNLNAAMGRPYSWFKDGSALLVNVIPADRPALRNQATALPTGPTVQQTQAGVVAQNRTYQDLLKDPNDEYNFETLITSELHRVNLDGSSSLWRGADMYSGVSFSPNGEYAMISTITRPFSYVVTLGNFPMVTSVYDVNGELVKVINERGVLDAVPQGFMSTYEGKRNISWRGDRPATLYWVEALDGGDQKNEVPFRDEVFQWDAPFTKEPQSMVKTVNRFAGIVWGDDKTAILYDYWYPTRNIRTFVFNPSKPRQKPSLLFDRSMDDVYGDPGDFDTKRNQYGSYTLNLKGREAYLIGDGYTTEGKFPFVDRINLDNGKTTRIYQSSNQDKLVEITSILDAEKGEFMIRMQSATEYPNYFVVNTVKRTAPIRVTDFRNPFKSIENIHKEVVHYTREDGVKLSGTLYLPAGYDMDNKERLPLIMWAYPTEYKDKDNAGQSTANTNDFTYPYYGSPIYWVTRGYAILDDASFPIVGEGDQEPNDTFIKQLVANAKAAIDALDELGYIDPNRVAVGGHSYGAFMTANLLTHSDLFAAGIARSGAYNRTLTPFGFQSEERNYWDAPGVYNEMSPFMHADKMKTPLLLIHGADDNNPGTHTMQSERYFGALKGFGAPVRLVLLPKESHGYSARESIMHMLWEQDQWLEKYVKNRKTE